MNVLDDDIVLEVNRHAENTTFGNKDGYCNTQHALSLHERDGGLVMLY